MTSPALAQRQHPSTPSTTGKNKATNPSSGGRKYSSEGYRSTPDSRSSVLHRARQYTRRIEEEEAEEKSRQGRSTAADRNHSTTQAIDNVGKENNHRDESQIEYSKKSFREQRTPETNHQQNPTTTQSYRSGPTGSDDMTSPSSRSRSASRRSNTTTGTGATNGTGTGRGNISSGDDKPSPLHQQEAAVAAEPKNEQEPVVSPELLVDALSGHEDGLLAIAERLMEHYDSGYDAMGEAIIDAFADVQKLFQHVVEAAHMEGAAFEASRREEEIKELRARAEANENHFDADGLGEDDDESATPSGPIRHDEFIDQDVKDCLNDAIKQGASLKDSNRYEECYQLYEQACQSASALLPVDSDHRGRLQLSIARAESMSPDRGCAILRYAMDDVLRSGLRAGKVQQTIDPSKRADVVLSKPKGHPSQGSTSHSAGVIQSNEEALNSLVAEMKEVLDAPVYKDTPLQDVAKRFWTALQENQKIKSKSEERLEHNLGKLKGDFLLARAEWEEKLNTAQEQAELYKRKYQTAKDGKETSLMDDARSMMSQVKLSQRSDLDSSELDSSGYPSLGGNSMRSGSFRVPGGRHEFQKGVESVASMGSNLAHHAKSLVGSFACAANNERTGQVINADHATEAWRDRRNAAAAQANGGGTKRVATATANYGNRHEDV